MIPDDPDLQPLPPDWRPMLTPELLKLLEEREAEADANPDEGYTLEEVFEYVHRDRRQPEHPDRPG